MSAPGLDDAAVEALARGLHEAERSARPIAPLTDAHPELSIADAYAVQLRGRALREAEGKRIAGRKIGLTSAAMQEMLGVDQPDFGYLTEDMVSASPARLSCSQLRLIAPRIEGEVAFRLGRPLSGPGLTVADVLEAATEVAPALEVIDSRVADWKIRIADTIADNASSAHVVLGAFRPLAGLDLEGLEMTLAVERPDGSSDTVRGRGDAVLGHPARPVAWLAQALAEFGSGERIAAGEIVIPGALARALPIGPGSRVSAGFGALGDVAVTFAEA